MLSTVCPHGKVTLAAESVACCIFASPEMCVLTVKKGLELRLDEKLF